MAGTRTRVRTANVASSWCGGRGTCPVLRLSRPATQAVAIIDTQNVTTAVKDEVATTTSTATQMGRAADVPYEEEAGVAMPLV